MIAEMLEPPAFDARAVSSLTGHPDDGELAVVLVTRYRALLPGRVRRIAAALAADESDDAMDAVLSLKVSSATVGAHELAGIAADLEVLLKRGDLLRAAVVESTLGDAAERADHELGAFLAG